jgi:hypothetical protein
LRVSGFQPLKRPSRSSVSRNSSETIVDAFVYGTTYSLNARSSSRM